MSTVSPMSGMGIGSQKDEFRYPPLPEEKQNIAWIILISLVVAIVICYFTTLRAVSKQWSEPQYSHGWLIPIFGAVLIWLRRETWRDVPQWQRYLGLGIIVAGIAMRIIGTIYVRFTVDNVSIIPCLIGAFILVGGLPTVRWAAPAIAFLVFMFPIPGSTYERVIQELKTLATRASYFSLETLGIDCVREGNVIHLESQAVGEEARHLGIADACSGLRMLTIFIALSVAIAMISTNRPMWERLIIVLSSAPIALAVNVIRITITGIMYNFNFNSNMADMVMHDIAGWIMMPMALGLLYLETRFLAALLIEEEQAAAPAFSLTGAAAMPGMSTVKRSEPGNPTRS